MRFRSLVVFSAFIAVVVAVAAITPQSLWIDEAGAGFMAMASSLGQWWQRVLMQSDANLQLIFHNFYLWLWEKVFGHSEFALRAANIPWFTLAVPMLVWALPNRRALQVSVVILAVTHALLWYYLSEARPYIVLFAFSSMVTACVIRLLLEPHDTPELTSWYAWFCIGLVGQCATSLIAVPWAGGSVAAVFFFLGPRAFLRLPARHKVITTVTLLALGVIAAYYTWTILAGFHASEVGTTSAKNLAFILYELSGVNGLGPGRLALREIGPSTLRPYLPWLAVGGILIALTSATALSYVRRHLNRERAGAIAAAVALPFLFVIAAGMGMHMRLLGRHFMPLLPFFLVFQALGLRQLWNANRLPGRSIAIASILMLAASALEIRFAERHAREDYRKASLLARAAVEAGQSVWWVADEQAGIYYLVPYESGRIQTLRHATPNLLATLPLPDLVLASKPDIYDPAGTVAAYLLAHDFAVTDRFPAFMVWTKPHH